MEKMEKSDFSLDFGKFVLKCFYGDTKGHTLKLKNKLLKTGNKLDVEMIKNTQDIIESKDYSSFDKNIREIINRYKTKQN